MRMARGLRRAMPEVEVVSRPMADGGEGTLDAVLAAVGERGTRAHAELTGAAGDRVRAAYGVIDGTTAVIEVAQIVGITDAGGMRAHVEDRSTRGIGELIAQLLDRGIRRFMIGLGGSSTNDGGSGLLACARRTLSRCRRSRRRTVGARPRVARIRRRRELDGRLASCELR